MTEEDLPVIKATPTKRFFVHMLTGDIELQDAILDLIDNCVDGIIRKTDGSARNPARPYEGFYAHIVMSPQRFEISDNCGGIGRSVLERAFRMGRPEGEGDIGHTVGMYGIGMKRAIPKMGTSCKVASRAGDFGFKVSISPSWMEDPDDWELPIIKLDKNDPLRDGTRISLDVLRPDVLSCFDRNDTFCNDFVGMLSAHYAIIIAKGFTVTINGSDVNPKSFALLVGEDLQTAQTESVLSGKGLKPYVFQGRIGHVAVEIYAGLYRRLQMKQKLRKKRRLGRAETMLAGLLSAMIVM